MIVSIGASRPEDLVGLLLECHGRIRTFSRMACEIAARVDAVEAEVVEACARCERYFTEALPLHVEDEEESLLPRLRGQSEEVDAALAAMHGQHAEHEALLARLLEALRAVRGAPGEVALRERLEPVAARAAAQLEEHLRLEEAVILPAVRRFSAEVQAEVLAELRARRRRP